MIVLIIDGIDIGNHVIMSMSMSKHGKSMAPSTSDDDPIDDVLMAYP
jgi:hypothetical protein